MTLKSRVDAAIAAAVGSRLVGAVVLVNQAGRRIYESASGYRDREAGTPMRQDAIFRLASVTKPMVATAILRLTETGEIDLDDPVAKFLPYFTPVAPDGRKYPITIRQLLTHTAGLIGYGGVPQHISPGMRGPIISLEENLRRLADVPLAAIPGTAWEYGMSIDVLGGVLATLSGTDLQGVLDQVVLGPLRMKDTRFGVADRSRLATPYWNGTPPLRMDGPFDVPRGDGSKDIFDADRIFNAAAPQSGGSGTAGTADDVMALIDSYQGYAGLLQPSTIATALRNQIGSIPRGANNAGKRFSFIGAVIDDPKAARSPCPVGTVDWGGAWGHNWILDPVNKLSIVVCTNTTPEGCDGQFRDDIRDAVYGAIAAGEANA